MRSTCCNDAISNQQTEIRKAQAEIVDTLNTLKQAVGNVVTAENVKSLIQEGFETTLQKIKDLEQSTNKHSDAIPIHVSVTNTVSQTGNIVFSKVKTAGFYYVSCAILTDYRYLRMRRYAFRRMKNSK